MSAWANFDQNCDRFIMLDESLVDGQELSALDRKFYEEHLQQCSGCAADLRVLKKIQLSDGSLTSFDELARRRWIDQTIDSANRVADFLANRMNDSKKHRSKRTRFWVPAVAFSAVAAIALASKSKESGSGAFGACFRRVGLPQ